MISRWTHWRRGGPDKGREAVPCSDCSPGFAKHFTPTKPHWGKITSRPRPDLRELEFLAWKLGCSVDTVKRAIEEGLI